MRRLLILSLLWISLTAWGQRYSAFIETSRASISGICVLVSDSTSTIRGSLFNEFGITALDFTYVPAREKVRLHSVMPALDHWYIRRVLRRDLRQIVPLLTGADKSVTHTNERYHITYTFTPLPDDSEE